MTVLKIKGDFEIGGDLPDGKANKFRYTELLLKADYLQIEEFEREEKLDPNSLSSKRFARQFGRFAYDEEELKIWFEELLDKLTWDKDEVVSCEWVKNVIKKKVGSKLI